jgi:hypothetical protein
MKKSEISRLLTTAAGIDQRTIGDSDVDSWQEVLGDEVTYEEAHAALMSHYRTSTARFMPAHVFAHLSSEDGIPFYEGNPDYGRNPF